MTLLEGGTLLIAIAAIGGSLYSIWRNGHSRRDSLIEFKTEIKKEIESVKSTLEDENHGLSALGGKMGDFQVHCATVSTSLKERVIALEDEANKRKPRKRKS